MVNNRPERTRLPFCSRRFDTTANRSSPSDSPCISPPSIIPICSQCPWRVSRASPTPWRPRATSIPTYISRPIVSLPLCVSPPCRGAVFPRDDPPTGPLFKVSSSGVCRQSAVSRGASSVVQRSLASLHRVFRSLHFSALFFFLFLFLFFVRRECLVESSPILFILFIRRTKKPLDPDHYGRTMCSLNSCSITTSRYHATGPFSLARSFHSFDSECGFVRNNFDRFEKSLPSAVGSPRKVNFFFSSFFFFNRAMLNRL